MDINFELYRVFCEVAREKSLSGAAKKLNVSQSAVSQSIKQLETTLSSKLFDRKARGVELTAEGKLLFEYADGAYTLLQNAVDKFGDMQNLKHGSLKIGASETVCELILTGALKKFHAKYPDINIKLINHTTGQLLQELRRGEIDIAFTTLPVSDTFGLNITKVMDINDCFVVSGQYASLARKTIDFKELENYPIMMLDRNSSSRLFLENFLKEQGIDIKPCFELASIDLLSRFAEAGIGVSAVIEQYVGDKLKSGELEKLKLAKPLPKRAIGVATLSRVSVSPACKKLIEILFEE
ncbi:MAG: LysR family transcriptional regulator [Clostridia bacterium]|nr:LysR family transcriptional regulator [Clostridia bacterium]